MNHSSFFFGILIEIKPHVNQNKNKKNILVQYMKPGFFKTHNYFEIDFYIQ